MVKCTIFFLKLISYQFILTESKTIQLNHVKKTDVKEEKQMLDEIILSINNFFDGNVSEIFFLGLFFFQQVLVGTFLHYIRFFLYCR